MSKVRVFLDNDIFLYYSKICYRNAMKDFLYFRLTFLMETQSGLKWAPSDIGLVKLSPKTSGKNQSSQIQCVFIFLVPMT